MAAKLEMFCGQLTWMCTACGRRMPGEVNHGPPCHCGDKNPRTAALQHAAVLREVAKDSPGKEEILAKADEITTAALFPAREEE